MVDAPAPRPASILRPRVFVGVAGALLGMMIWVVLSPPFGSIGPVDDLGWAFMVQVAGFVAIIVLAIALRPGWILGVTSILLPLPIMYFTACMVAAAAAAC